MRKRAKQVKTNGSEMTVRWIPSHSGLERMNEPIKLPKKQPKIEEFKLRDGAPQLT